MKFKYNIGDKVIATRRKHPDKGFLTSYCWINAMDKFAGKPITITNRVDDGLSPSYNIEEISDFTGWCEHWLDPASTLPEELFEI
jgi:hypothetical protein